MTHLGTTPRLVKALGITPPQSEKLRRVLVFAAYEAKASNSPYLDERHLFLGALREDRKLANRYDAERIRAASVTTETLGRQEHLTLTERARSVLLEARDPGDIIQKLQQEPWVF